MKVLDGLDLLNQQLRNLADGSSPTDAVTLQQMQAFVRGLDWKASVRAASTANVNVSSPGATLDGITLNNGDRVLLKNQTTGTENGIYVWNGSGATLTRPADASSQDGVQTLTSGAAVLTTEGTVNADTAWVLSTHDPITVGTTSLTFVQFGGGGASYTAGNGLTLSGTAFNVTAAPGGGISVSGSGVSLDFTKAVGKYAANVGDGSTTSFTVTHSLGTSDVNVAVKNASTGEICLMAVTVIDANSVQLVFPAAPSSSQYRVVVHG